jgi:acyl carrier protein
MTDNPNKTPAMNHGKEVRDFIVTNFLFGDAGSLQDDTSFLSSGIIDSTGMLELIMFLENTWDVKIEPGEMIPENLDSIQRVVQFLARKLAAKTD